ncbi:SGNH/GDSL hydrolase family protein [Bradyrhizobium sp. S3.7.6]
MANYDWSGQSVWAPGAWAPGAWLSGAWLPGAWLSAAVPAKIALLRAHGLAAKPLAVMASPPTITMNATANANSSVVPANYDAKYTATDPLFTYVGGVVATQASSGPPGAFWAKGAGSNLGTGNGYQGSSGVYFKTADANVDLSFVAQNNIQCGYRISIDVLDGNGLKATALQPRTDIQALADFSGHRVKIANGSSVMRGYRVEFENFLFFAGVDVAGTIQKWDPGGPTVLVTGDSHTDGTGASSKLLGMAQRLKEALGVDNVLAQGQGGTGYLTTSIAGTETMRARIPNEITPRNPDLLIDLGGYNDQTPTPAALQAEVTAYYAGLTAALPNVPVIKVLPPRRGISTGAGFTPSQARADAIKAAVQADSRYGKLVFLVDSWAADWEHGTGRVGATTGDGNADTWVGTDNVHRTDVGHSGWQTLMGPAIRTALGISSLTVPDTNSFPNDRYAAGSYMAIEAVNNLALTRTQSFTVNKGSFPNGTKFNWSWPAGADDTVKSWNAIDYGNYLDGAGAVPVAIAASKISAITALKSTHSGVYTASADSGNFALDWFLFSDTSGTTAKMVAEFEVYYHTPNATKTFIDGLTNLGTYTSVAIDGTPSIAWKVARQSANFFGVPYYLAYPVDQSDKPAITFDAKAFMAWLSAANPTTGQTYLTGNEYFTGYALGIEPLKGTGSLVVDWSNTYAVTTPTNLISAGAVNDLTNAFWTKSGADPLTGALTEQTNNGVHGVTGTVSKTAVSKNYVYSFDVDTARSRSWIFLQVSTPDFGATGAAQAYLDITNAVAGVGYSASGSFTIGTPSVVSIGGGKSRVSLPFTAGVSGNNTQDTSLLLQARLATGNFAQSYLGDVTKGMNIQNAQLYEV